MSFMQALDPARVILDREVQSKKGVIQHLSELFSSSNPELSSGEVFDALIAREKLGSTGLGHGVAIPHGRVSGTRNAIAALLIADNPIDFDAVDNEPVDIFVALLVPEDACDEHLRLLSEIAELFADNRLARRLRNVLSADRAHALVAEFEPQ